MPLGSKGGGTRSYRPRYPSLQGPDVTEGGGGGGGTAPAAPSSVTTPTVASRLIGMGGFSPAYTGSAAYQTWKGWGFAGHGCTLGGVGVQGTQLMLGSTAAGQNSNYDWQKAYEGLGVPAINGGNTGLGPFKARQADSSIHVYLIEGCTPHGDWFDNTTWNAQNTKNGNKAAGVNFLGGQGIYWDFENTTWEAPASTQSPGHTEAEMRTQIELRGYQTGLAMYTAFPACNICVYHPVPGGSFFDTWVYSGADGIASSNLTINKMCWIYGVMRAGAELNCTGRFAHLDHHLGYRFDTGGVTVNTYATPIKWSTQGTLAQYSQTLPAASRNHWMGKIDYRLYTWADCDNTSSYFGSVLSVADYNTLLEYARQWSMGGIRHEFVSVGTPSENSNVIFQGTQGPWYGHSPYSYPTGRPAGLLAATSTSTAHSSTAPVLSASASGSGSTRTITGTASHAYGIRTVKAYIYPSGTAVHAVMTFNTGGGTPSTGITNSYMDYTLTLTGVASGNYAIVTAYSTLDQEKSNVVAL